ncbi:MAG TPA: OsmC family peroxiredoxin [Propionibacteriaceae bacterium]|jgi:osmotically inducible protein OsmC|nr:OsmC family peroxiredoxin [Propionibacteriaceae bacterium]
MAATRTAEAHWEGSLKQGQGEVDLVSSGIGQFEVSWPARTEAPNGLTSPEELIAAAHSTCFSMSVANELVLAGNPAPTSVDTKADVTFQPGQGITGIELTVTAVVPGIDEEAFSAAVAAAEKNCPVSRALTGTTITVQASLAE